jgi:hypothetical protein
LTICSESNEVKGDTVESWKECLPEIIRGYEVTDIKNMAETGCCWPEGSSREGLAQKGMQGWEEELLLQYLSMPVDKKNSSHL